MFNFKKPTLALVLLASALLTGCAVQPVPVAVSQYDGDPCNQSYFDALACQQAIQLGGWYLGGVLHTHYYGGYNYGYYYNRNHIYIQHGGRVVPYSTAVHSVHVYNSPGSVTVTRPGYSTVPGSANSASRSYTPSSQRPVPSSSSSANRSYTPAPRSGPSPSPGSSRSYSSSRRR